MQDNEFGKEFRGSKSIRDKRTYDKDYNRHGSTDRGQLVEFKDNVSRRSTVEVKPLSNSDHEE